MEKELKIKERFLEDIKNHKLNIILDMEGYRHISCTSPNTYAYGFEIITYPGGLLIRGDMGTCVFERTKDMFSFFRTGIDKETNDIRINPGYWSEKVQAESRFGDGIKEFDEKSLKTHLKSYWETFFEDDLDSEQAKEVWEAIEFDIIGALEDYGSEDIVMSKVYDFGLTKKYDGVDFQFEDAFEWDIKKYTHHFLWLLYAIVWTIREYDKLKEQENK